MILDRLFPPRPAKLAGRRLYEAVVAQARTPELYTDLGATDSNEGRFEVYTLHVVLVLHRLKLQGDQAAETNQALFDAYVQSLDDALREIGVGDVSVGKKMRKLGEAFYGRAKSYDAAFAAFPADPAPLVELLKRTVLEESGAPPEPLVAYVARQREALDAQPLEALLAGEVAWSRG